MSELAQYLGTHQGFRQALIIMDCGTNDVVDFSILQKEQVTGSIEHQALRQVTEVLAMDERIKTDDLVID